VPRLAIFNHTDAGLLVILGEWATFACEQGPPWLAIRTSHFRESTDGCTPTRVFPSGQVAQQLPLMERLDALCHDHGCQFGSQRPARSTVLCKAMSNDVLFWGRERRSLIPDRTRLSCHATARTEPFTLNHIHPAVRGASKSLSGCELLPSIMQYHHKTNEA
jgi:hypothetical protein